jgi:hypothetical protein
LAKKRPRRIPSAEQVTGTRLEARESYLRFRGEKNGLEQAINDFKSRMQRPVTTAKYGLSPLLISVLIQLGIALIKWWWNRERKDPGFAPLAGEPRIDMDDTGEVIAGAP